MMLGFTTGLQFKIIALGIAAVLCFSAGWKARGNIADAERAKALEERIKAQDVILEIERSNAINANEVSNALQKKLTALGDRHADILNRLYTKTHSGKNLPSASTSAAGCDAAASGNRLSWEDGKALFDLAKKADHQTDQLIACQAWLKTITK